jgi:hypothetical protein
MLDISLKKCSKCAQFKRMNEFHKNKKEKCGLKSACKICLNIQSKQYMQNIRLINKDILNEKTKKWRKNKIKENPNYYKEQYYKNHEQNKLTQNKFYYKNKELCLVRQKEWRENNKEIYLESSRNWKKNNREQYLQNHKDWIKKNADLIKEYNRKRRAFKRGATIQNFTHEQLMQRMSIFGFKCSYCNGPFEHLDHVIPLSKGGKHCLSNLRPSCQFCNCSKHNKNLFDWLKKRAI